MFLLSSGRRRNAIILNLGASVGECTCRYLDLVEELLIGRCLVGKYMSESLTDYWKKIVLGLPLTSTLRLVTIVRPLGLPHAL